MKFNGLALFERGAKKMGGKLARGGKRSMGFGDKGFFFEGL
jgi:hypothetical protein